MNLDDISSAIDSFAEALCLRADPGETWMQYTVREATERGVIIVVERYLRSGAMPDLDTVESEISREFDPVADPEIDAARYGAGLLLFDTSKEAVRYALDVTDLDAVDDPVSLLIERLTTALREEGH